MIIVRGRVCRSCFPQCLVCGQCLFRAWRDAWKGSRRGVYTMSLRSRLLAIAAVGRWRSKIAVLFRSGQVFFHRICLPRPSWCAWRCGKFVPTPRRGSGFMRSLAMSWSVWGNNVQVREVVAQQGEFKSGLTWPHSLAILPLVLASSVGYLICTSYDYRELYCQAIFLKVIKYCSIFSLQGP